MLSISIYLCFLLSVLIFKNDDEIAFVSVSPSSAAQASIHLTAAQQSSSGFSFFFLCLPPSLTESVCVFPLVPFHPALYLLCLIIITAPHKEINESQQMNAAIYRPALLLDINCINAALVSTHLCLWTRVYILVLVCVCVQYTAVCRSVVIKVYLHVHAKLYICDTALQFVTKKLFFLH